MACLSIGFLENLLIWLVIIGAIVALVRLVLPLALGNLGVAGSTIAQALNIVLWAAVVIFLIVLIFDLIACLMGAGLFLRR